MSWVSKWHLYFKKSHGIQIWVTDWIGLPFLKGLKMFCFLKPWQRQYHCVNTCKIYLKYNDSYVCFKSHRPCGPCLWFFKVTLFYLLVFPNSLTLISMIKVMRIFKVQTLITHLSKLKTWTLFGNEQRWIMMNWFWLLVGCVLWIS